MTESSSTTFRVVCISHTDGAGGQGVGRLVAETLGYRYVDEQLLEQAARIAQVDPAVVAAAEQKQTLVERLLDALSAAGQVLGAATLSSGFVVPTVESPDARPAGIDDLRAMIRAAIHQVHMQGAAVIVAHAASLALGGKRDVLRVLVTAPASVRSARIAEARGLSAADADAAVARGDEGRRSYMKSFYGVETELPTHYDLVLNTEHLTPQVVVAAVVGLARG